jgi:ATP phosphoribosyltransferase regulatory subunit
LVTSLRSAFSAYIDPLIDAGLAQGERRRLFLPIGTMPQKAASLRAEGWVTVAQLTAEDSAEAQICSHVQEWEAGAL